MSTCGISSSTTIVSKLLNDYPKERIRIQNPNEVEKMMKDIIDGGREKLQVIADFDYTLTRVHDGKGQRIECSWGVIENSSIMSPEYVTKSRDLKAKYLPYELDPHMSIPEKIPYLVEWYEKVNKLLQQYGTTRSKFKAMVEDSNVDFRDGARELIEGLEKSSVPLLILSAGLGDLVLEILKHQNVYSDNVKVVSNFIEFDSDGNVTGLKQPMIHVFNKNENSIKDMPYFKSIKDRSNIILMGDSLGDLSMAEGFQNPDKKVLKIGFLNEKIPERLATYMDKYDIVLLDDQTMDVPQSILDQIIQQE